jgi:hypothetical protein
VERHAREFRNELAGRAAGSQQEQAASAYIVGHLQQAGYVVLLDAVPLQNLIRSTNVIAQPPSGADAGTVVVVSYDASGRAGDDEAIGLFLELARALRARSPRHDVEFAALGAEHARVEGGRLGSRRLARELLDSGADPFIVRIASATPSSPLVMRGPGADTVAGGAGRGAATAPGEDAVFAAAGFDHAVVSGSPDLLGRALLDFLAS